MAADPPGFPSKSGRSGRFGRTVRPRSAGQTGADRADGPSEAAQRVGGSHPFGWRLRGTRVVSGALMISRWRARQISRFGSPGGTRRDDLWRGRAGFRSGSLAQSGPARGTSGRIGGQWDALATSCVRGEVGRRRRAGSGPAWVQRRAGSGEGGVEEIFGVPGSHPVRGVPRLRISWHVAKKRAICGALCGRPARMDLFRVGQSGKGGLDKKMGRVRFTVATRRPGRSISGHGSLAQSDPCGSRAGCCILDS